MPAKILVVEDHADSREMLTTVLGGEGFTIVCACDGQEGYDLALVERPDIILTDLDMPNVDGIELIERLRRHPEVGRIPILVLSAYQSAFLAKATAAGANSTMSKPVQLALLIKLIRTVLSGASLCLAASGALSTCGM